MKSEAKQMLKERIAEAERQDLVKVCECFGCRTNNMFGCSKNATSSDHQAVRGY